MTDHKVLLAINSQKLLDHAGFARILFLSGLCCMYVCMSVGGYWSAGMFIVSYYVCLCMHLRAYMHVHVCVCILCVYACGCMFACVCVRACMCVCMHVCVFEMTACLLCINMLLSFITKQSLLILTSALLKADVGSDLHELCEYTMISICLDIRLCKQVILMFFLYSYEYRHLPIHFKQNLLNPLYWAV